MTAPETPPTPAREGMPIGLKLVLFMFLPTFLALVIVASLLGFGALRGFGGFGGAPVSSEQQSEAGESVFVDIDDADLTFEPSTDSQVHVTMEGTYSTNEPEISVETVDGVTEITGGCERVMFFSNCRIRVTVEMPADLALDVQGVNGRISIDRITGAISVETTNGGIDVSGASADLELRTNNGEVSVRRSSSTDVVVSTTNGRIELELTDAPTNVDAATINGSIKLQLPVADVSYDLNADTVLGDVETDDIPVDRGSDRTIRLETTNGSIDVEPLG